MSADTHFVAKSSGHPCDRGRAYVFSVRLVRPLAACMLPVMIGALLAMVQGMPALYFLYAGFPLALGVAAAWTAVQTGREIVEVHLLADAVAVRSVLAAAKPMEPLTWYRLLDVRHDAGQIRITVGYDIYQIERKDWPQVNELEIRLNDQLRASRPLSDI